jgi:putative flippase GtrA
MSAVTGTQVGAVRARVLSDRRTRYLAAGVFSCAVYYTLFAVGWLVTGGRVPYLAMVVLANIGTALLTYPLYRQRVFADSGPVIAGFLRFYVASLTGVAYFLLGLPVLVEVTNMPVLAAQAVTLVTWPVVNYQLLRRWAFRKPTPPSWKRAPTPPPAARRPAGSSPLPDASRTR